jgi:molybdopterin-containing oxidoreductase family iron-sulfur binding subunit
VRLGKDGVPNINHGQVLRMQRRDFLKLVIGGTTISFWAEPLQFNKLIPFLVPADQLVPGVSTWYATSCRECPAGCGQIIRNREARATKAEGNPLHPINAGTLCARGQAGLQGLYDPDRIRAPIRRERGREAKVEWQVAMAEIGRILAPLRGTGRVAVISDLQSGSLTALIGEWLKAFGSERYLVYEPFNYEPLREANRLVFGRETIPDYHLDRCDFLISFAADFLETWISPVKWIRRFAETRVPKNGNMGKFVYVGPRVSMTACNADEYLLVKPGEERWLALAMIQAMASEGLAKGRLPAGVPELTPEQASQRIGISVEKIRSLARQFGRAKTPLALAGLPLPGGRAAIEAALAANLLNLAAQTSAVDFSRSHALGKTARTLEISDFVSELGSGQVEVLVIISANPAYSLPPGLRFAEALKAVPTVVSLSAFPDETAALASWVLPADTPLESWGDYEPETGVANLMQPVMGTRHQTQSAGDILLALANAAAADLQAEPGAASPRGRRISSFYDYLRERWARRAEEVEPGASRDEFWQQAMKRGGYWRESRSAPAALRANGAARVSFSVPQAATGLALWAHPSAFLFDGRGANKRWLQETPDVVSLGVWGSWVEVNPQTARRLGIEMGRVGRRSHRVGVEAGQILELSTAAGSIVAPALVYPGLAPDTVSLQFGQGHAAYGRYAADRGANAFQLLSEQLSGIGPFPEVDVTPQRAAEPVVRAIGSTAQHDRAIVEAVMLSKLPQQRPKELFWPLPKGYSLATDIYPPHSYPSHRWAMAVDLGRCVGCEACVAACYAENNVAVVGKRWVSQGREMSWLRIDRYYQWESPQTPALFLPMLCQHCDAAPCEPVCPVFAAHHTDEGLNAQVYNRCIGTRYCNNNCPYKVRRFNWRNYDWPEELTWQLNPDVTVRCRGVMEKCTFCVQRIDEAEARAKKEARPLRDGEITPACVQTCPAQVFVFGDLMDPNSRISRLVQANPRRFQVLSHLNTKPAVIYLKRVVNDSEPT